MKVMTLY